jgi:SAM-dependent methyltransferase
MDIQLLYIKIVQKFRTDGLQATIRKAFAHLTRRRTTDDFDVRHGTDTAGIEPLWKFKIRSPNARLGVRYQASGEQELVEAVNFLHEDPQTFTFIDLGCGKGRALLVASKLGFQQVIGVEFARELVDIARSNLAKMRSSSAVVRHADAAEFHFPNSDMVVYLYNPFSQEVMRKVVANLRQSPAKRLYVIYSDPKFGQVLDSSGFLNRLGCPPGLQNIQIWTAVR